MAIVIMVDLMGKISIVFDTKNSKKTLETSDESEAKSFVIDNIKKADLENVKIEIHKLSATQTDQ